MAIEKQRGHVWHQLQMKDHLSFTCVMCQELQILSGKLWQLALAALNSRKCSSRLLPNPLLSAEAATIWAWPCCLGIVRCLSLERLPSPKSQLRLQDFTETAQARNTTPEVTVVCMRKHVLMAFSFPHYFPTDWAAPSRNTLGCVRNLYPSPSNRQEVWKNKKTTPLCALQLRQIRSS